MKTMTGTTFGTLILDVVKTCLDKIKLFDGFPGNAICERLHDNLDFRHEMETCLSVLPPASIVGPRKKLTQWEPVNITIPTLAGSA
jgi:hypothetical protein